METLNGPARRVEAGVQIKEMVMTDAPPTVSPDPERRLTDEVLLPTHQPSTCRQHFLLRQHSQALLCALISLLKCDQSGGDMT